MFKNIVSKKDFGFTGSMLICVVGVTFEAWSFLVSICVLCVIRFFGFL